MNGRRILIIALLASVLATGASFFVGEFVLASVPGGHGAGGSAEVYGFPLPYATFFPCCGAVGGAGYSVTLDNTYYYHPLSFAVDVAIWFVISVAVVSTFSIRRLLLGAAGGAGLTLATLFLGPLAAVAPTPGMETAVLTPMGFPHQYLTYYAGGFLGNVSSGYEFALSPALADYALWSGIAMALFGIAFALARFRSFRTAVS